VLSAVRALPGVVDAAYISFLPMAMRGGIWPVVVEGKTEEAADAQTVSLRFTTPGFFDALRIPLRIGRDVSDADTGEAPFVAVVSESFAKRYWPGENPLDRHFQIAFHDRRIVGVAGDVRVRGLERTSEPQVYLPSQQVPDGWMPFYTPKDLVVRSTAAPGLLLPALRRIVGAADPEQPISDVQTLSHIVESDTAPRSVQAGVLGAFAAIAVLLAGIGIQGLLAFTVSNREQEIGVRMALGANPAAVRRLILGEVVRFVLVGAVIGLPVSYAVARVVESILFGVHASDVPVFAFGLLLMAAVALLAGYLPAHRAARIDPLDALRND
jgi:putative ABC transport system permease protein